QYGQPQYGAPVSPLGTSSIGLDPKVAAGLGYLIPLLGLIFFFMEKQNRFVRFNTLQAVLLDASIIVVYLAIFILSIVFAIAHLGVIGALFGCIGGLAWLGYIVLRIVGCVQAFQGKTFKIPVIGDYAQKWAYSGIPA
ncbi:MAG: DUF4870 domain-containing protein, partial [Chloroflexota bacterium]|nr:DUF4870 domain-containing protein [Chloroflexota bacterium]